jgi:hypothetical protein
MQGRLVNWGVHREQCQCVSVSGRKGEMCDSHSLMDWTPKKPRRKGLFEQAMCTL